MKSFFRFIIWFIFIFGGIGLSVYLDHHVFYFEDIENKWIYYAISGFGAFLFAMTFSFTRNVGQTLAKYGRKAADLPRMQPIN